MRSLVLTVFVLALAGCNTMQSFNADEQQQRRQRQEQRDQEQHRAILPDSF